MLYKEMVEADFFYHLRRWHILKASQKWTVYVVNKRDIFSYETVTCDGMQLDG